MTSANWIGLLGIAVLLLLMALRMPIGTAMLLVGIIGFGLLNGWPAALAALGNYPYQYAAVYDFSVIPLFVLMGNLGSVSGMARDLYSAAYSWIGHVRGGLAHATILACAGFRRGVGIERRFGRHHGQGLPAGDAALQLQPSPGDRRHRRRRYARHPDPALDGVRDLRTAHRAVDRPSAARRHPAGHAADRDFHDHGRDLDALQAALRPARPAR